MALVSIVNKLLKVVYFLLQLIENVINMYFLVAVFLWVTIFNILGGDGKFVLMFNHIPRYKYSGGTAPRIVTSAMDRGGQTA
jgi:hypothetical protein